MNGQKDVNTLLAMMTSSRRCCSCSSSCILVVLSAGLPVLPATIPSIHIHCYCHCFILLFSFSAALGSSWQPAESAAVYEVPEERRVALLIIECYFYFGPLRVTISVQPRSESRFWSLLSGFPEQLFCSLFSLHLRSGGVFHSCKLFATSRVRTPEWAMAGTERKAKSPHLNKGV